MLKMMKKNRGQNTAEYAILIALVIGAIIAMQTYAQRGLQARMRGTSLYMKDAMGNAMATARGATEGAMLNKTGQYEAYYQNSSYTTVSNSDESVRSGRITGADGRTNKIRELGGYDETKYNATIGVVTQD